MIQFKTLKYLDVLEVLDIVETRSKRPGLKGRVWTHLCDTDGISNGCMTDINIEDSYKDLVEDYGQVLGEDHEAIKQAVSHLPLEEIQWYATW